MKFYIVDCFAENVSLKEDEWLIEVGGNCFIVAEGDWK